MDKIIILPTVAKSLDSMLKKSIQGLVMEVQKDSCDFAHLRSNVLPLVQSRIDPPLEITWLYCALGYHEAIHTKRDVLARIFAIRDLRHHLLLYCATCSGVKSVVLLAPVVSELYHCLPEEKKLTGKVKMKFKEELKNLAKDVSSSIRITCVRLSDDLGLCNDNLLSCFDDIVPVWAVQHSEQVDHFRILFPLLSKQIRYSLRQQGRGLGYLAGAVMAEVFLLYLNLQVDVPYYLRPYIQEDLRFWAVSMISKFENYFFFDILLMMLLNSQMPILIVLGSVDEGLVRNVLYDAVILVDYSFTRPGVEEEHFNYFLGNLYMRRLIVTHEAIQIARGRGDHNKAISYTHAFATSWVPNALIKWATYQVGLEKLDKPNTNSPQGLLKWFLVLEKQGFKLFEDEVSELLSKLAFEECNVEPKSEKFDSGSWRTDGDLFFFDNKGRPDNDAAKDEEMSDNKGRPDNDAAKDEEIEALDALRAAVLSLRKERERRERREAGGGGRSGVA